MTMILDKTRIVYCTQHGREEKYPVTDFTFLGFDFRRAPSVDVTAC
ncbi:MAG: hypothetical protein M3325_02110 [Actinomycetota bacterium]|nr:hypothetical protein [Actinomycetota bacterium]